MGLEDSEDGSKDRKDEDEDLGSDQNVKMVDWEEFHEALVHLGGVAAVLAKVRAKKEDLFTKLQASIEVGTKSLLRVDALESIQQQLQEKKCNLDGAIATLRKSSEQLVKSRERLLPQAQSLLVSATALSAAQGRVQEADRLLVGEGGHGRLLQLQRLLDGRRRQMVGQVASLYPLATCASLGSSLVGKQSSSSPHVQPPGTSNFVTTSDSVRTDGPSFASEDISMAIAGLQILVPIRKQPGLFSEKNDYESSATALGYVAHVVSLVASYLDVQLRYPVRLGASRSYVQDHCPAIEHINVEATAVPSGTTPKTLVEFPLFSEGQELTRSAYAVFLLNKDLEQMLNVLGVDSVGPRHTLPNLNRLINTVTSGALPFC